MGHEKVLELGENRPGGREGIIGDSRIVGGGVRAIGIGGGVAGN